MSTVIDGDAYAGSDGIVMLSRRSTLRFSSSTAANAGLQLLPANNIPFDLTLTKFVTPDFAQYEVDYQLSKIGQPVHMQNNGIAYFLFPYAQRFHVLDVQILDSRSVVHVSGSVAGVTFEYAPGWKIVSRWTMQAVAM